MGIPNTDLTKNVCIIKPRGVCMCVHMSVVWGRSRVFTFRGRQLISRVENSRTSGVTSYFATGR